MLEHDVHEFFRDKAYAFTQGQMRYVSLLFKTPCEFKIGLSSMSLDTHKDIASVFQIYRSNLQKKGYVATSARVEHVGSAGPEQARCLVTYENSEATGRKISVEFASYLLQRVEQGLLQIQEVEFVEDPLPWLFEGMEHMISGPTAPA